MATKIIPTQDYVRICLTSTVSWKQIFLFYFNQTLAQNVGTSILIIKQSSYLHHTLGVGTLWFASNLHHQTRIKFEWNFFTFKTKARNDNG